MFLCNKVRIKIEFVVCNSVQGRAPYIQSHQWSTFHCLSAVYYLNLQNIPVILLL